MCHRLPLFLIHELAHAWERHTVTDSTRSQFLNHWNLERWNDHSDDWNQRGIEKAAHTVAYTLTLDKPTDNENISQFVCGFELLTGDALPNPDFVTCPITNA